MGCGISWLNVGYPAEVEYRGLPVQNLQRKSESSASGREWGSIEMVSSGIKNLKYFHKLSERTCETTLHAANEAEPDLGPRHGVEGHYANGRIVQKHRVVAHHFIE